MIQVTPQMRVLVAIEPVELRRGIDGMAQACRSGLRSDPLSGAVFVFRSRRGTAVKVLVYDGPGWRPSWTRTASRVRATERRTGCAWAPLCLP